VISWDEAKNHYGETLYVQGPVDSVYVSGGGSVTIHLGLPYPDPDRFDIYIPSSYVDDFTAVFGSDFPDNLVGETVCIYGEITTYLGIYEIETHDPDDLQIGPCCGVTGTGPLMNFRGQLAWDPLVLTADFADCCTGIQFRKLEVGLSGLSLCCGLSYDVDFTFSKCHGFEGLAFSISGLDLLCCDISLDLAVEFTVDSKTISVSPSWEGITGCFELYGDVDWDGFNTLEGLEIWGWGISCYIEPISLTIITALNPDEVENVVDISFYTDEWEYLGLEYVGPACCGGDLSFTAELWFGDDGLLFSIQRTKYYLELPLANAISVFVKAQWDFSDPDPLDYLDVGWGGTEKN